jgi:hypothetical protein
MVSSELSKRSKAGVLHPRFRGGLLCNDRGLFSEGPGGTGHQPFNVQREYVALSPEVYGASRQNPYSHQQAAIL